MIQTIQINDTIINNKFLPLDMPVLSTDQVHVLVIGGTTYYPGTDFKIIKTDPVKIVWENLPLEQALTSETKICVVVDAA